MIHTTDHDISLQNRIELGKLPLVKSVTPLEPRKGENEESSEYCVVFADESPEEEESHRTPDVLTKEDRGTCCLFPEVDLGDLSEDQNILVMNMWTEEADSFPKTMIRVCKRVCKTPTAQYISLRQSSRPEKTTQLFQSPCIQKLNNILKICLIVDV